MAFLTIMKASGGRANQAHCYTATNWDDPLVIVDFVPGPGGSNRIRFNRPHRACGGDRVWFFTPDRPCDLDSRKGVLVADVISESEVSIACFVPADLMSNSPDYGKN